jgi:peroxiredoxin
MESTLLDTNDLFPEMTLQLINGETLRLPQGAGQGYGVIFFYRGYW